MIRERIVSSWLKIVVAVAAVTALPISDSPLAAQDEEPENAAAIIGHVVDAQTETPLAGVWVSVEGSDWGSFTNNEGRFLLPEVEAAGHAIRVEQLGYRTVYFRVDATQSGTPVLIRMEPDPILLEGLEIVTDRFQRRRRSVAISVRAFDQEDLANSFHWSLASFLASRAASVFPCRNPRLFSDACVWARGREMSAAIYVDEAPIMGGWMYFESISPHELYMVEVYGRGRQIRAYTHAFMKRAAGTRLQPLPIIH